MSVYELPVNNFNNDIQEQIKLLQEQIKPNINPIIEKILPFPYDVNKNILDKLHIQKLIHIYKTNLKIFMNKFIENRLPYFYEEYIHMPSYGGPKKYDSELDYEIRNKKPVNIFYYVRFNDWREIDFYECKYSQPLYEFCNLEFHPNNKHKLDYDMKQAIKYCKKKIMEFDICMCNLNSDTDNDMIMNLSSLDKQEIHRRTNENITIGNEIGDKKTFKIFKSNGAINPKPYYQMKEYIKEYVLRKKTELENIIEQL